MEPFGRRNCREVEALGHPHADPQSWFQTRHQSSPLHAVASQCPYKHTDWLAASQLWSDNRLSVLFDGY